MKKLLILFSLIFITSCSYINEIRSDITGEVVVENIKMDSGSLEVYFCPRENCENKMLDLINSSEKIHCALYELDLDYIINELEKKDYFLIVDDNSYKYVSSLNNVKQDNRSALMHNKFCIFDDETIITGSFNPKKSGLKNNNNFIIIKSKYLSENYEEEFQSFIRNEFGRDEEIKYPRIILNNKILIENYFCPEDNCEQHVYDTIKKAKNRIYFMTFSFTSDKLGDLIIEKSNETEVKGIFEKTQSTTSFSEYPKMIEKNLNVIHDKNPEFMHHKVFIVDDIVVLGSYNPTSSGNSKNDENILIIYDKELADKFLGEFDYVWNL